MRLNRACTALAEYRGEDKYLLPLRDVLKAVLAGIERDEKRIVTAPVMPGDSQEVVLPRQDGAVKKLLRRLRGIVSRPKR